jgi:hypothetical protein
MLNMFPPSVILFFTVLYSLIIPALILSKRGEGNSLSFADPFPFPLPLIDLLDLHTFI